MFYSIQIGDRALMAVRRRKPASQRKGSWLTRLHRWIR
jgi:hypothetical protein